MQGTIQTLRLERGFGFLRGSEGIEVLFHHSAALSRLLCQPDRRGGGRVRGGAEPRRAS
jgi:cold shock CspA family protein